MNRRRCLQQAAACLPIALLARPAGAAETRRYAMLSLVGDVMSVVVHQPQSGSALHTNRVQMLKIDQPFFDDAALLRMDAAIKAREPEATTTLLRNIPAAVYERQNALFSGPGLDLPAEVAEVAKGVSHLVALTKHRAEAALREISGHIGSGKLEGLGYYLDGQLRMKRNDNGEQGVGFLAPYAFVKVQLFDLASNRLVNERAITASATMTMLGSNSAMDLWKGMSPARKFEVLRDLLQREVAQAIPPLLAG